MSYLLKKISMTYHVLGLISGFWGFFDGMVSVDVSENIIIEQHFSRRFQRYFILFSSSNIHRLRIFTYLGIFCKYFNLRNRGIWKFLGNYGKIWKICNLNV